MDTDPASQSATQMDAIGRENLASRFTVHIGKTIKSCTHRPYDPLSN